MTPRARMESCAEGMACESIPLGVGEDDECKTPNKSTIWERRSETNGHDLLHNLSTDGQPPNASNSSDSIELAHVHHHIFDSVYMIAANKQDIDEDVNSDYIYFSIDGVLSYVGFSDDFGPMSLGTVYEFCNILESQLRRHPCRSIAMRVEPDRRSLTNAVFLMGAFMIMKLDISVSAILKSFDDLIEHLLPYRDVSPGKQNFELHLEDCWNGLHKAKQLGWVNFSANRFDAVQYATYDDPLNADLHEIVPGKFVAMRGPRTLAGNQLWQDSHHDDGTFSHREFSPKHYIDTLLQLKVQAVVRLNAPEYPKSEFTDAGIAVADLFFPDCTSPSAAVIAKFMAIAEAIPGAIAVHCKAGLGRTGTLIALYIMKNHGFSAREAMGWIRVVRPGSIIGTQQHFLCDKEPLLRRSAHRAAAAAAAAAPPPCHDDLKAGSDGALAAAAAAAADPVDTAKRPGLAAAAAAPRRLSLTTDVATLERFIGDAIRSVDWQVQEFRRRRLHPHPPHRSRVMGGRGGGGSRAAGGGEDQSATEDDGESSSTATDSDTPNTPPAATTVAAARRAAAAAAAAEEERARQALSVHVAAAAERRSSVRAGGVAATAGGC